MNQCKRDGCGSYAINDHKESGLCDKCYWIEQAEKLSAERDKLKKAAQAVVDRWDSPNWKDQPHTGNYISDLREALKESA